MCFDLEILHRAAKFHIQHVKVSIFEMGPERFDEAVLHDIMFSTIMVRAPFSYVLPYQSQQKTILPIPIMTSRLSASTALSSSNDKIQQLFPNIGIPSVNRSSQDLCDGVLIARQPLRSGLRSTLCSLKQKSKAYLTPQFSPREVQPGRKDMSFQEDPISRIVFSQPILQERPLLSHPRKISNLAVEHIQPPKTENVGISGSFTDLEKLKAPLVFCDLGLWSHESKEILRKSTHTRPRIFTTVLNLGHDLISMIETAGMTRRSEYFSKAREINLSDCAFRGLHLLSNAVSYHRGQALNAVEDLKHHKGFPSKCSSQRTTFKVLRKLTNAFDPPTWRMDSIASKIIYRIHESWPIELSDSSGNNTSSNDHSRSRIPIINSSDDASVIEAEGQDELEAFAQFDVDMGIVPEPQQAGDILDTPHANSIPSQPECYEDDIINLSVPTTMACTSWLLQVSEHCLHLQRGVIFVPPMLNVLPSLVTLAFSHLSKLHCDNRVVVVCEGDESDLTFIHRFFKSCLPNSVSIDLVRRRVPFSGNESIAHCGDATGSIGRIVIVDSFEVKLVRGFSLLLVALSLPSQMGPHAARRFNPSGTPVANIMQWKHIRSVFIAPANVWTGLRTFTVRAGEIAKQLGVSHAIFISKREDISFATELAKPRVHFVAPGKQCTAFCEIVDDEGLRYLSFYNIVEKRERWSDHGGGLTEATCLRDVDVALLRMFISNLEYWDEESEAVARLFDLRQARSYALHDGLGTAISFIEDCQRRNPSRSDLWSRILQRVQKILGRTMQIGRRYAMGDVLQRVFRKTNLEMAEEAPSIRGIHRRDRFIPLVVTDSIEACEQLRQQRLTTTSIISTRRVAANDPVTVLHRDEISESGNNVVSGQMMGILNEASHVFHVMDDRADSVPDNELMAQLLQNVFCGRTRLISVCVDEFGIVGDVWRDNGELFKQVDAAIWEMVNRSKGQKISNFICDAEIDVLERVVRELSDKEARKGQTVQASTAGGVMASRRHNSCLAVRRGRLDKR